MGEMLQGQWAVVTGASANIGYAIATALAREGADLVVAARRQGPLEQAASAIAKDTGRNVETVVADVGLRADRLRLVEHALNVAGCVDVLVNNAYLHASTDETDIFDLDDDVWEKTFSVNVHGPFDLARRFGREMRAGRGGNIVNIVAGPGLLPARGWAPYGVTTAGLWMLTRYLAVECAPAIRVNAVCPGTIAPEDEYRKYAREVILPTLPMQRTGRPEEVAGAVIYLVSPAASYTTGALIAVNGGRLW